MCCNVSARLVSRKADEMCFWKVHFEMEINLLNNHHVTVLMFILSSCLPNHIVLHISKVQHMVVLLVSVIYYLAAINFVFLLKDIVCLAR